MRPSGFLVPLLLPLLLLLTVPGARAGEEQGEEQDPAEQKEDELEEESGEESATETNELEKEMAACIKKCYDAFPCSKDGSCTSQEMLHMSALFMIKCGVDLPEMDYFDLDAMDLPDVDI